MGVKSCGRAWQYSWRFADLPRSTCGTVLRWLAHFWAIVFCGLRWRFLSFGSFCEVNFEATLKVTGSARIRADGRPSSQLQCLVFKTDLMDAGLPRPIRFDFLLFLPVFCFCSLFSFCFLFFLAL